MRSGRGVTAHRYAAPPHPNPLPQGERERAAAEANSGFNFQTAKTIQLEPSLRAKRSNPQPRGKSGLLRFARNDGALSPDTTSRPRNAKRPSRAFISRP